MPDKLTQLTSSQAIVDTDLWATVQDMATTPVLKGKAGTLIKSWLKTYFDTLYVALSASATLPLSIVDGLTLSNNVSDVNNDIDVASGKAVDSAGTENMVLASGLTKRLDAAWSVGNNQGGLDTGAEANSTWYHVFLIKRTDTGVVDVLFSTSATSPTMPTNYTKKRRIGSFRNDGSGNIIAFLQYGDTFLFKSPPALSADISSLTTTKTNFTMAVPGGVVVEAILNIAIIGASAQLVYVSNPNLTDVTPVANATPLATGISPNSGGDFYQIRMFTDTSSQISAKASAASTTFRAATLGWVDPRGKW